MSKRTAVKLPSGMAEENGGPHPAAAASPELPDPTETQVTQIPVRSKASAPAPAPAPAPRKARYVISGAHVNIVYVKLDGDFAVLSDTLQATPPLTGDTDLRAALHQAVDCAMDALEQMRSAG